MKTCVKQIVSYLFLSCFLYSSSGEYCNPSSCPNSSAGRTGFSNVLVQYPFRINDLQAKSCGVPGFELYCDDLGTFIQINGVVLRVEALIYSFNQIYLSDPHDICLPQKLMSLNLDNTPFNRDGLIKNFWLYNCTGEEFYYNDYDRIDCFNGTGYTVISSGTDIINNVRNLNCTLLTILNVSGAYYSFHLSEISTIYLNWDNSKLLPPPRKDFNNKGYTLPSKVGMVMGVFGMVIIFIFCCWRRCVGRNEQATTTNNRNTITSTSSTEVITGLDHVTIESYPQVVIGESGRLIKPEDDKCPICLCDYRPRETLKLLPECLHRFHADCINQWLRTKGICPICRTSPPRLS